MNSKLTTNIDGTFKTKQRINEILFTLKFYISNKLNPTN